MDFEYKKPGFKWAKLSSSTWPNVRAASASEVELRWREENGAANAKEYLSQFPYTVSKPNTYTASVKPPELGEKWGKVIEIIKNGSWDAIYADSEQEFESILARMYQQAEDAGYGECVLWCEEEAARRKASEE